ncbi:glycoside hydrolase family 43 protein [uncultured Martelella sp.]|uniref:glycoside hydrolase family 43 protein n=1 Tax=uncultured Martelella sp. TaxID=392331 RepID=UPI0029C8F56F|nr:glycoside hydrolase family 43 protein [uncultured Martelella sp.]
MTKIVNPILKGFNADPAICRAGEDYYIATSTFEWFPGVQIHHSRDLKNWELVKRPLDRTSQLDMRGEQDSGGVWAPCLTYADGLFWLIYTDMKRAEGDFKDAFNYLVTAPAIEGPWSDPVYLNASGFDPSLFHDDDGRKYLTNQLWDYRRKPSAFAGIVMQEYSHAEQKLIGEPSVVYHGTPAGITEGPHIQKFNDWYYMITAEGGTGYNHTVSCARSKSVEGPYENHPDLHILTSRDDPQSPLQRSGHGCIVETPDGEYYMAHLMSRPLPGIKRSVLGRETSIQKVVFDAEGWPRLADGGMAPSLEVDLPKGVAVGEEKPDSTATDFDTAELPIEFQWLRSPEPGRLFSLSARPGHLRLFGRQSIGSWFEQALVARRQTAFACAAETETDAAPKTFQQLAGLIAYYNRSKFHYLAISGDGKGGRELSIISCNGAWPESNLTFALRSPVALPAEGAIRLGLDIDGPVLQFRYAVDGGNWVKVGPTLDASILSDEGGRGVNGSFTGNFIGMAAYDLAGGDFTADFDGFSYQNL